MATVDTSNLDKLLKQQKAMTGLANLNPSGNDLSSLMVKMIAGTTKRVALPSITKTVAKEQASVNKQLSTQAKTVLNEQQANIRAEEARQEEQRRIAEATQAQDLAMGGSINSLIKKNRKYFGQANAGMVAESGQGFTPGKTLLGQ